MTMLITLALAAAAPFPERMPGMMEACVENAMTDGMTSSTVDENKYICVGEPARALWDFLEAAKTSSYEQQTAGEGRWLSRIFPLGGCFKRVSHVDGSPATDGLSCTIWVPRPSTQATPKPKP
ncbi:MAG: hypothetical protein ABI898_13510 [Sphingomonadales bacterium]